VGAFEIAAFGAVENNDWFLVSRKLEQMTWQRPAAATITKRVGCMYGSAI